MERKQDDGKVIVSDSPSIIGSMSPVGKPRICVIHARENCARCIYNGGEFVEQNDKETDLEFELFQAANDALFVLDNLGLSKTKQSEKVATRLRVAISDYMNK